MFFQMMKQTKAVSGWEAQLFGTVPEHKGSPISSTPLVSFHISEIILCPCTQYSSVGGSIHLFALQINRQRGRSHLQNLLGNICLCSLQFSVSLRQHRHIQGRWNLLYDFGDDHITRFLTTASTVWHRWSIGNTASCLLVLIHGGFHVSRGPYPSTHEPSSRPMNWTLGSSLLGVGPLV